MKVEKSFLSAIIWMDMDPISRKMKMKNVAGFHPFWGFVFFPGAVDGWDRSGFGTRDFQKEGSATELTARARTQEPKDCLSTEGWRNAGERSARWSATRFMFAAAVNWATKWCSVVVGKCGDPLQLCG
jgi:hypothetical protein